MTLKTTINGSIKLDHEAIDEQTITARGLETIFVHVGMIRTVTYTSVPVASRTALPDTQQIVPGPPLSRAVQLLHRNVTAVSATQSLIYTQKSLKYTVMPYSGASVASGIPFPLSVCQTHPWSSFSLLLLSSLCPLCAVSIFPQRTREKRGTLLFFAVFC